MTIIITIIIDIITDFPVTKKWILNEHIKFLVILTNQDR